MKYIGLLLIIFILSACQSAGTSETYDTHTSLNDELLLLLSENNYLSGYLAEMTAEVESNDSDEDSGSYNALIETFIKNIIPELEGIQTALNETESHSIALSYSTVNAHVQKVREYVLQLESDISVLNLNESQESHFDSFQITNNELIETLDILRRGVEINDITQVNQAIESIRQFSNKY